MVTSARNWKNKQSSGNVELTLPSGNTCLMQRLKPEAFLTSGKLPDSLSDIVTKAIRTKKGLPPDMVQKMTEDPRKMREGLQMIDEVLCYVVIEPIVEMPPRCGVEMAGNRICGEYMDTDDNRHTDSKNPDHHVFLEDARDEDTLYADEVSLEDKNFIFQFAVGGTADVERFRQELSGSMAGVPKQQNVSRKGKRSSRHK